VVERGGRPGRPAGGASDTFAALADPTRRLLLERLAASERTVTELADGFAMSQAAISQHLRSLRDAGLVEVRPDGRHRYYRLRREGLTDLRAWLDGLQRFWDERVAALDDYLKEQR
jgi:DNA-binding transcriptional ArsR family regulator